MEDTPPDARSRGYRPHLDGIRTVAVYLVVLFHAGINKADGGYIGVDVFFVLSGYLVGQLLLREAAGGRIRFARFYARRVRRLLPASFVVLVATALAYAAVASPVEVDAAEGGIRASFLYVANWYFIRQSTDYFAPEVESNPVVHFWSLAVEEQFYLLAPLLLACLFWATRRLADDTARRARQALVLGGLVASLATALLLRRTDLSRAYFGTDARAYQLLAGVFLAMSPGLLARAARTRVAPAVAVLALLGLGVASSSLVDLDPVRRGVVATVLSFALIAAVEAADGPLNRLLSLPPMVYLGRISYGTYLWHWPVIVVMGEVVDGATATTTAVVAIGVASGLASLSFHLLEQPIRTWPTLDGVNRVVVAGGLTASVLAGFTLVPALLDPDDAVVAVPDGDVDGFTPVPPIDADQVRSHAGALRGVRLVENCVGEPTSACTVVTGPGEHVLVVGDSHAQMFFPAFAMLAQTEGLTLSTVASAGCPWQQRVYLPDDFPAAQQRNADCDALRADLYERVVPELRPDVIVAVSRDYLSWASPGVVRGPDGGALASSSPADLEAQIRDASAETVELFRSLADRVVVLEPIPVATPDEDPLVCLSESDVVERCRFTVEPGVRPIEQITRGLADGRHVWSLDIDRLVCPFLPICDPIIDGVVVRRDYHHIAPAFSVEIADELGALLLAAGALDPDS